MSKLSSDSKIAIVGSGVFGISTALWFSKSGYNDVTVFDMQDTASTGYDPDAGVDSASADINKILRFSYGSEIEYQRLASEAAIIWEDWNHQLAQTPVEELPEVLRSGERRLWYNCGMLRMSITGEHGDFEEKTLENMEKEGIRHTQFKTNDPNDIQRAKQQGWSHKLDPCQRLQRFGDNIAVLDSSAGYVAAYKGCAWAQFLARKAGVRFHLGPDQGKVIGIESHQPHEDISYNIVKTQDGGTYRANLVIVAGGGWTPSLLPEVSHLLEATAGSVSAIQLPENRQDLWDRYSPESIPVITWGMRDEAGGVYSLPRTEKGVFKVAYRGTKYTNFDEVDGSRISVPKTAHVTEQKETNIPLKAMTSIKNFITANFPELREFGFKSTKLCWYTDSIDDSFFIDYVPGRPGVAVCSGGSGHGFKFLPILGREVVKILEGQENTVYKQLWRWREPVDVHKRNGLEQGESGPRVLNRQTMARSDADWTF